MKSKHSLTTNLLVKIVVPLFVLFILFVVYININEYRRKTDSLVEHLEQNSHNNADKFELVFGQKFEFVDMLSGIANKFNSTDTNSNLLIEDVMFNQLVKFKENNSVWILLDENRLGMSDQGTQGWVLAYVNKNNSKIKYDKNILMFHKRFASIIESKTPMYSNPYKIADKMFMNVASPIIDKANNTLIGFAGITVNLEFLNSFVEINNTYKNGFITIINNNGEFIGHKNTTTLGKTFEQNFPMESLKVAVSDSIIKGKSFSMEIQKNTNVYYSYFEPVYFANCDKPMSIVTTVPSKTFMYCSKDFVYQIILSLIFILVFIVVVLVISKNITKSIINTNSVLGKITQGKIKDVSNINDNRTIELSQLVTHVNNLIDYMKQVGGFAVEVNNGNLDTQYDLKSQEDELGKFMIGIRDILKKQEEEEQQRINESNIKNWTNEGIAKFSEILRQNNNNLKALSFTFTSSLVDYLDLNQMALFALNNEEEETDKDNVKYDLISAVAYGTDKYIEKSVKMGEGLVGRCAYEQKTILLTEVPDDYYNITSGLGTANPNCILIVPCIFNGIVFCVLEMASFKVFEKHEIEFVELLAESIASSISTTQINETTNKLLENSKLQKEELLAQEEELRQGLEEMQTTQDNLQMKVSENERMQYLLKKQEVVLNRLLENIEEQVYVKDNEGKYLNASKSLLLQFGMLDNEDIIGKTDFELLDDEVAKKQFEQDKYVLETQNGFRDKEVAKELKDGSTKWVSLSKIPIKDWEDKIIGLMSISNNINKVKNLEELVSSKEIYIKEFIDILKQNAFVMEYDSKGEVIYINNPFATLLKVEPELMVGQHISETWKQNNNDEFDYQAFWEEVNGGRIKRNIVNIDVDDKEIWLSETFIPIYNEENIIEKILKIAFDITSYMNTISKS